ncbi:MAG: hypothetical protein JJ902_23215 [Roseibium sp.]|nr:hypothetical protein [Roseibium sp.]
MVSIRERIVERARIYSDTAGEAEKWFVSFPIPGIGGKTAEELVEMGLGDDVLDYLDAVEDGAFQ